jgi:heptaprenyl diphosphate synthase
VNTQFTPRRITILALFAAVGTALFVLESFIPTPFPFLKIGLANVSSVLALMVFGAPEMMLVVVIRVVAGAMLVGSLFSPAFILAFAGGTASALAMAAVKSLTRNLFSVIGISLIGSVTHVLVQLIVVFLLYVQNAGVMFLLPLLLASALFGGLVVGWVSARLLTSIDRIQQRS